MYRRGQAAPRTVKYVHRGAEISEISANGSRSVTFSPISGARQPDAKGWLLPRCAQRSKVARGSTYPDHRQARGLFSRYDNGWRAREYVRSITTREELSLANEENRFVDSVRPRTRRSFVFLLSVSFSLFARAANVRSFLLFSRNARLRDN